MFYYYYDLNHDLFAGKFLIAQSLVVKTVLNINHIFIIEKTTHGTSLKTLY